MNGLTKSFKEKQALADAFIERIKPYEKPEPLKFDLRGYADFIKKNNLSSSEITPEMAEQFRR